MKVKSSKKGVGCKKVHSYRCEYCEKSFSLQYNLKKHLRSHTGERPYECNECGAKFSQSGGLRNHTLSLHQPEQTFVCHYCDKGFPIKDRLKLHLRTHTGEKPYSCKICNKTFARGSQLSQHRRTHTKTRPFKCALCESSFVCRNNLLNHIKRHQGERDYVCDVCGKSFVRRDGLQKHLAFHANHRAFECKICNRKYKGHLLQHMRIHMEEKPHACAHCQMRFVQRSQLTVHERTHSGIKPYRCQVCHMAFAHSTALKMHVRRHTGEKPFKCLICPNKAFSQLPHLKKHMLSIHKTDKPYMCIGCRSYFKTKNQLDDHEQNCKDLSLSTKKPQQDIGVMPLDRMRLLLAVLLQKISTPTRLESFGYGKKLIDQVLCASIESSGRTACNADDLDESERLKRNVEILLEWTVPKVYMEQFKKEQRSTEELLEELTS